MEEANMEQIVHEFKASLRVRSADGLRWREASGQFLSRNEDGNRSTRLVMTFDEVPDLLCANHRLFSQTTLTTTDGDQVKFTCMDFASEVSFVLLLSLRN
jgi:hypothetical protein